MGDVLSIKLEGIESVVKELISLLTPERRVQMNREIGFNVQQRTADHIARASVSRHKTADKLGAPHSGFLEFAPGRTRSESRFANEDGSHPYIANEIVSVDSVTVIIGNTPGLSRALHSLIITPKRAKALTIPINAISYGKRVKDVKGEGWKIHRQGKVLIGKKNEQEKPLFALVGKVTIPQDRELLPSETDIQEWSLDSIEAYLESLIQ